MNRGMLLLVTLLGAMGAVTGCGDDSGSGGSGASGTGGEAGEAEGGGPPVAATCADYCATIIDGCVDSNTQYADQASCEATCAAFPQGDLGAMSENSLECRTYHAGVAAGGTDPPIHCVHAGPLGSGPIAGTGCGSNRCEAFCQAAEEVCGDSPVYSFENFDDCTTQCAAYTDTVDFNIQEISGDTLACRMYHLSVAATGETDPHCGHLSGSECTD